jgi:hypothetical protein
VEEMMTWFDENHKLFKNTELYLQLQKDFVHLYPDRYDEMEDETGQIHRSHLFDNGVCVYNMFVYLQLLLEKNPSKIADVGCGINYVKKYIPGVVGFDKNSKADYQEFFDDEFIDKHRHEFDCAFAVNSVHFIPLEKFKDRIIEFSKIIKPGGRGYLAFNMIRIIQNTTSKILPIKKYVEYIDQEIAHIKNLPGIKILVYDNTILEDVEKNYEMYRGADWPEFDDRSNPNLPKEIREELDNYGFTGDDKENPQRLLENRYSGNVRIVFEVDK